VAVANANSGAHLGEAALTPPRETPPPRLVVCRSKGDRRQLADAMLDVSALCEVPARNRPLWKTRSKSGLRGAFVESFGGRGGDVQGADASDSA
jgi:hypothetical protein